MKNVSSILLDHILDHIVHLLNYINQKNNKNSVSLYFPNKIQSHFPKVINCHMTFSSCSEQFQPIVSLVVSRGQRLKHKQPFSEGDISFLSLLLL